jgi:hypothetical protein
VSSSNAASRADWRAASASRAGKKPTEGADFGAEAFTPAFRGRREWLHYRRFPAKDTPMMFPQRTALRASLALALLLACGGAFAQNAIERQMTPEEFKAAGLDKLSPGELANLNAWLNRTLETETTKAAAEAKKKVEDEDRGFFHFNSDEPIVAHLVGEFRSFA